MNTYLTIGSATYDEVKHFISLWNKEFKNQDGFIPYTIRDFKETTVLVCKLMPSQQIVGYIGFQPYSWRENTIWLSEFFIVPKFRRKKYGTEILNQFINLMNGKNIILDVDVPSPAVRLYRNAGFSVIGYTMLYKPKIIDNNRSCSTHLKELLE